MNSAQFIRALKSADKKDFSYSIKNFNINETKPAPSEINKSLSCSFVSVFRFGKAELILNQGIFIDYFTLNGITYQRKELHRIDYLDSILVNGFDDIEGGRFDLVFLLDQLDRQGIVDPHKSYKKISVMVDLMFDISSIKQPYIIKLLLNAFDNYVISMPDVDKLDIQGSHERFVEHLIELKMSQIEPNLKQATYEVSDLSLEEPTNLHHFVSGNVTTRFSSDDCQFTVQYHMVRQYPIYTDNHQMLRVNNTNFDEFKSMDILAKIGEISLNLADKDSAIEKLSGNSALFFKLQSIFGMVKRGNSLEIVTDKFDHFYHNALVEQKEVTLTDAETNSIDSINAGKLPETKAIKSIMSSTNNNGSVNINANVGVNANASNSTSVNTHTNQHHHEYDRLATLDKPATAILSDAEDDMSVDLVELSLSDSYHPNQSPNQPSSQPQQAATQLTEKNQHSKPVVKKEDLLKPMLNHMFWRPLD